MPRIRLVAERDLAAVAQMIDDFAAGHPAQARPRSRDRLRDACLGDRHAARMLVAERQDEVVGMIVWQPIFDFFWSMWGAEVSWLYVRPASRGHGVALRLIARTAADVRAFGGEYLHATYGAELAELYGQVAKGGRTHEGHVSAERFATLADLHDDVRALVRYARQGRSPATR